MYDQQIIDSLIQLYRDVEAQASSLIAEIDATQATLNSLRDRFERATYAAAAIRQLARHINDPVLMQLTHGPRQEEQP